jgi:hypothetical protein
MNKIPKWLMFVLALLWVFEVAALSFNISSCMLKSCGFSEDRKTKDEWITEVANTEIEKNIYFGFTKTAYPISSSIVQKTDDVYAFIQIRAINEYTTIALCCVYLKVVVPNNLSDSKKIKQSQILIQPIDTQIKVFYN